MTLGMKRLAAWEKDEKRLFNASLLINFFFFFFEAEERVLHNCGKL